MANYTSQTVITETLKLDDDLVAALEARGATCFPEGEEETVLDGIVNERSPLKTYSIVWEEGWRDAYGCDWDEFLLDYAGWDEEQCEEASERLRKLVILDEPEMLLEILKLNDHVLGVEMQEAQGCSKMRLDGFAGRSLTVTRKGYLYISTTNVEIADDGTIKFGSSFVPWADENADSEPQVQEVTNGTP